MQGCCPHRNSPSSPRKIAAGILGTKSCGSALSEPEHRTSLQTLRLRSRRKPPVRTAFRIVLSCEMVCSLICKQMGKRDDSYGSIRFRSGDGPLPRSFGSWRRVWRPRPVLSRLRADITSTLICSPFGGGRHALEPLCRGLRPGRTTKSILLRSPLRQKSKL